ncbi:hypothetical protein P171DRAFT_42825 [Karstenula rhodostoma CBS 690.94]|uniref:Secreted protein n=1 Tax=Karstenula rhodostoma CBS 690.94 TaxID=1392251 RepID=A0A9P4PIT1_9PLEO|nr:hypothetical protein P171DRAFT_42825 [Karstenula rhodostoma CBS 690.94]
MAPSAVFGRLAHSIIILLLPSRSTIGSRDDTAACTCTSNKQKTMHPPAFRHASDRAIQREAGHRQGFVFITSSTNTPPATNSAPARKSVFMFRHGYLIRKLPAPISTPPR